MGQWVEIANGVTSLSFHLIGGTNSAIYKIHTGTSAPAQDTDIFISYALSRFTSSSNAVAVMYNNSTAENVYVMCVDIDGYVII